LGFGVFFLGVAKRIRLESISLSFSRWKVGQMLLDFTLGYLSSTTRCSPPQQCLLSFYLSITHQNFITGQWGDHHFNTTALSQGTLRAEIEYSLANFLFLLSRTPPFGF